jgi:hypothetical protein
VDVDADCLADALAAALTGIVPEGFHVRAADGMLWFSAEEGRFPGQMSNYHVGRSGTYVRDNLEAHGDTAEDRVAGIAVQALDELQDYIDEATHDPRPGTKTPPQPFAEVRDKLLHLCTAGRISPAPQSWHANPYHLSESSRPTNLRAA